jgi:phage shock protein C
MQTRRLTRSHTDRVIGGVAGGIAAYFSIDPLIIRLIFLILALMNGVGAMVYLVLWLLMPVEGSTTLDGRSQVQENVREMRETTQRLAAQVRGVMQDMFRPNQ